MKLLASYPYWRTVVVKKKKKKKSLDPLGIGRSDSGFFFPWLSTDLIYFIVSVALGLITSFLPQPWLLPSFKWEESQRLCQRSAELVFTLLGFVWSPLEPKLKVKGQDVG